MNDPSSRRPRSLWFTLVCVLILVGCPLVVLAISGHGSEKAAYAGAETPTAKPPSIWVVRAYYTDSRMIQSLAAWLEPWEVNPEEHYVVVGVDQFEMEWLKRLGFIVEADPILTDLYNRPRSVSPSQTSGIPGFPCYRTVEETYASMQNLVAAHPNLASWIDIGDSWEKVQLGPPNGHDIMVLRLTNSSIPGPKPKILIIAAIHAREYATAELVTRFAEYLVNSYNIDANVTWLLDYHEIHLLPQANPDGRKHAENYNSEDDRWWRKNTNQNYCSPTSYYRGADLNRNFVFQWGCCMGSSTNPCAETYRGVAAASEAETQAIQNYLQSEFPDQRGEGIEATVPITASGIFLDIHSYGRKVMWPWGFTSQAAPNAVALQTLGRKLAYFNNYDPIPIFQLYLSAIDGDTIDFAYGELGLAALGFEIGTSFHESCDNFENIILGNNLKALLYAARSARSPYQTPAGPDATDLSATPAWVQPSISITISATINDTRYNNSKGSEPVQNISAAEYYLDIPPWSTDPPPVSHPMDAQDGAFDEPIEDVFAYLDTTSLEIGRHILFLRGRDTAGNWGVVSALFIYIIETRNPVFLPLVMQIAASP